MKLRISERMASFMPWCRDCGLSLAPDETEALGGEGRCGQCSFLRRVIPPVKKAS